MLLHQIFTALSYNIAHCSELSGAEMGSPKHFIPPKPQFTLCLPANESISKMLWKRFSTCTDISLAPLSSKTMSLSVQNPQAWFCVYIHVSGSHCQRLTLAHSDFGSIQADTAWQGMSRVEMSSPLSLLCEVVSLV